MALNPIGLAPLLVVVGMIGLLVLAKVEPSVDRSITRITRRVFGRYVTENEERKRILRSAYIGRTYRAYAARTILFTALAAIGGAISGVYLTTGALLILDPVLTLLQGLPNTIVNGLGIPAEAPSLSESTTLVILTVGGTIGGLLGAGITYWSRWLLPKSHAVERQRAIDEGMARMIAFMYAMSRGGVPFPAVLRTIAENDEIYGENAREIGVAVRQMDLFGQDLISAVRSMSQRTPSDEFKTFSENLASVLQSGQSLSAFLNDQYERHQSEAAERQEDILERLATIAEAYVTVLVAAVLFLFTILLVFGLVLVDTLPFLQLLGYVMVPLANAGFMVYLADKLDALGVARRGTSDVLDRRETTTFGRPAGPTDTARADGGVAASDERWVQLALYDRFRRVKRVAASPLETIHWNPTRLLYVTLPLALLYLIVRLPDAFAADALNIRYLDDLLIQATLFVLGTYAIARTVYVRRIDRIENATPDLLERLASLNEAGMTMVESLSRIKGSDLGALTPEVDRIWADVSMGSNVEDALVRFGRRIRTTPIIRVVTLLTNAVRASGKLGPVLRIAARQARADLRMHRQRKRQMLTYLVVIYISFLVFLVIIVAVQEVLVPNLPTQVATPETDGLAIDAQQFARFGRVDKAAYTLVFFHVALLQAVLSGFVGGQIGEGSLRDGAKHAAIMLGVAYLAFIVLSSPVASITASTGAIDDGSVTIDSASLSDGGYVAVYEEGIEGDMLGHSEYLVAGTHKDVVIDVEGIPDSNTDVVAVAHFDTDDNQILTYDGTQVDRPYDATTAGEIVSLTIPRSQR